ncbi:MAG: metalloregulator ArsR/SmtB family transcription factor [Patescibacteria group bacterium]
MDFDNSCSGCFAGLSCGIRIEIINLLKKKKKLSVSEISKHFKVTQPTITHHLNYLKESEILTSKKEGRMVFYSLNPKCKKDCGLFE